MIAGESRRYSDAAANRESVILGRCRESLDPTSAYELASVIAAVVDEPTNARAMHQLALRCLQCGYVDLWQDCAAVALALPHVTPQELFMRAQAKIRLGDWSGWIDREARLSDPEELDFRSSVMLETRWTKGAWDGAEDLAAKTIFVFADGGLGDCVQMLRYVPVLAEQAREVVLAVHPRCVPFAQHNFGDLATVVIRDLPYRHAFERYAWIMSLPALLGRIPPFSSFSAPSPREYPTVDGTMHLALCWAGVSNHPNNRQDRFRSLSLCDLAPLLTRNDVTWHSVQIGRWASEANQYPSIIQPAAPLHNLAQTANMLAGLDGIVTVDTSVAHLAGALGIPTFLILSTLPDFRWGMADTTPWYPSMQLVRQQVPGDWSTVVATLMARLDRAMPASFVTL